MMITNQYKLHIIVAFLLLLVVIVSLNSYNGFGNRARLETATAIKEPEIPPFWFTPSGGLMLGMQVSNFPKDGIMDIPKGTKKLYIEIGANSRNIMQDEINLDDPEAFLITFEPILDKYAAILKRYGGKEDSLSALGYQHSRGIVLPFAISPEEGYSDFNLAQIDGCSSLMDFNDEFPDESSRAEADQWWPEIKEKCVTVAEKRRVPTVSLLTVLSRWIPDLDVEYLKVDAQGFDLTVFESAGVQMKRFKSVSFETVSDTCPVLYKNQPRCSEVLAKMKSHGFEPREQSLLDNNCAEFFLGAPCEIDVTYYRVE